MLSSYTDYQPFDTLVGVSDAAALNAAVADGRTNYLINAAETLHSSMLARIADDIAQRYAQGEARVVLIAGPSSSGKTTTTMRLSLALTACLLKPQMISLDDYFVNRTATPCDESGEYDYESLYALDITQFNTDLNHILDGREVELPTYNFTLGQREYLGNKIRLEPNGILLIEGIHGLNPELTAHIADRLKYRIYVAPLTPMPIDDVVAVNPTDSRMMRRIVRDRKYRGVSAAETLRRWSSVRRGEERWIYPYRDYAQATFNSSLLYETAVMKRQALEALSDVPPAAGQYAEAQRLTALLTHFDPMPDDKVPPTSVLREFLGNSSFHY